MTYFLRKVPGRANELWRISEESATNLGVLNPEQGAGTYFAAVSGKTVWDVMREQTPWFASGDPFVQLRLDLGDYHPRIARPLALAAHSIARHGWTPGDNRRAIALAQGQLGVLATDLVRICRSIHPEGENLQAYGHDSRNLLILASTEVEAAWRGVLTANGYPVVTKRLWKTTDYVKLAGIMRLSEYAVSFPAFPWLDPVRPFAGWTAGKPGATASLPWYADYNGLKHDRDANFRKATLANAFLAVSACAVMIAAQFGRSYGMGTPAMAHSGTAISGFFHFSSEPEWPTSELYAGKLDGDPNHWNPVNHPELAPQS